MIISLLFLLLLYLFLSLLYPLLFLPAFVCEQLYTISYEWISMKFSGSVGGGTRKNLLDLEVIGRTQASVNIQG